MKKKKMGTRDAVTYMMRHYVGRTFCVSVQYWHDRSTRKRITLFCKEYYAGYENEDACEGYEGKTWEEVMKKINKAEGRDECTGL